MYAPDYLTYTAACPVFTASPEICSLDRVPGYIPSAYFQNVRSRLFNLTAACPVFTASPEIFSLDRAPGYISRAYFQRW